MLSTRSELNTISAIGNATGRVRTVTYCLVSRNTGADVAPQIHTQVINVFCACRTDPKAAPYLNAGVRLSTVPIFGTAAYWYHLLRQHTRPRHRTLTKA